MPEDCQPNTSEQDGCEATWAEQAKAGDRGAFDKLRRALEPDIRRFVGRLIGSSPATDDVIQDAFVSLYLNLDHLEPVTNLRPFLYRIVRNRCYDELRRKGRFQTVPIDDPGNPAAPSNWLADSASSPDEALQSVLVMAEIQRAMDALPEVQREALILFAEEGMSLVQVAEAMGTEVGTVKSRIFHARRNLRRGLTPATRAALGLGKETDDGQQ